MKLYFLPLVSLLASFLMSVAQDSSSLQKIDSLITANESRIVTSFQKTIRNTSWASHGKNPERISVTYRFANNDTLISFTHCAYTPEDTQIIVNLYFNSGRLIKAITRDFDMKNKPTDYPYYYDNSQLLNNEMDSLGIHKGTYYTTMAAQIRKRLKRKPIRF
jgi:hypothetical protein